VSLHPPIRKITLCYVTDRKGFGGSSEERIRALSEKIVTAARAGVDWIQIREKDLVGRALVAMVEHAVRHVPSSCRILVNDRLDVAIAADAAGVHLGETSLSMAEAKRLVKEKSLGTDFLFGVSVHSLESAQAAEKAGADYVIFGPVYETPSKMKFGPSQGLERLAEVCERVGIPVVAIGGITEENARQCIAVGASGIAAIRMFQDATDMAAMVRKLHQE
jgi:thiamine-phosphate pyrophosphorylase